jgi:RNase H-fold protein (predicted Holliday junction resolvase)
MARVLPEAGSEAQLGRNCLWGRLRKTATRRVSCLAMTFPSEAPRRLRELAHAWADTNVNERAAFQTWLLRFCEALGVATPDPPTDSYRFEVPVQAMDREGRESTNFIDCWKSGHFALEAKASGDDRRNDSLLRKAFGQVRNYVAYVSGDAPPYLMVLDVPRTLIVWDRWSGAYGDFAAGRRIALNTLHERPEDIQLLYDIFVDPSVRDPRGKAQVVTREIAAGLAELAAELESRGLDTERVARFLMRCVFSCFAEDVGLLPENLFRRTLETARRSGDHERLAMALTSLWKTMDSGGMFGAELLHRFNGHFFKTVEALPLAARDVDLLIDAAKHDWSRVEPSIFGTLLVRALDPEERHRLGAEYTPRAYIERLVEPTVIEPIRERWTAVQAAALQLEEAEEKKNRKKKDYSAAVRELRDFHDWMRALSFLDPACGSGNFLYVTMAAVKRIEQEVMNEIARLSHGQGGLVLEEVHPRQFHGIEVKPWAREIAELTLWIGYHQFWRETHGGRTPPDPILEDTGTIECRDAVLAWDEIVHRPERDRPDPTPRIVSPITGEMIPDPNAKLPYYEYVGARQAEWPQADFIIGNPPYVGNKRMRSALGDGYVDALRATYNDLPDSIDLVMYWWWRAARLVETSAAFRAGLITTNSISQPSHQPVVREAASNGARIVWTVADHPWVDTVDGADVRVALTVISSENKQSATWVRVDDTGVQIEIRHVQSLNADLSCHANVVDAAEVVLLANRGLASVGFDPQASGFVVSPTEAASLLVDPKYAEVVRPYVNGRDLVQRPRGAWIIDFGLMDEASARLFPLAFDIVRDRVRPERISNKRESYRTLWWRFGEPRRSLRDSVANLTSFIASTRVSKHRFFCLLATRVAPDGKIVCIATEDMCILGTLSAQIHIEWALAAGAHLGVGNDPTYNHSRGFNAFPFPDPTPDLRARIAALAERLDAHRKSAIARDERVTMTGMYNVVEKLRSGEALTPKERAIHEIAACGVLRDMHDELDALVAESYGWPWPMEKDEILERLVALHDERVEEESRGVIRWLRPEYQIPRFAPAAAALTLAIPDAEAPPVVAAALPAWPSTAVEQLSAIGSLVAQRPLNADEIAASFTGAQRAMVARHLETLALMGEVTQDQDGRYGAARKVA